MIAYYLLFTFFGILAFTEHSKIGKSQLDFEIVISFLVLLFFYGLRYNVGIDWYDYNVFFNQVEPINLVILGKSAAPYFYGSEFQIMEIGYRLLNSIFKTLGGSFQSLIFIIALFNLTSLYSFLYTQKIKFKFTLLTIFISLAMFREFDVFRQSISFYIFLYSLKYLNTNLKIYILINLVGSLFHLSSIIFILIIPILKIKFSRSTLIIILTLYLATFFIAIPILTLLLKIGESFQILSPLLVKVLSFYKYLNYSRGLGLTISLPCIILFILAVYKYNIYEQLDENSRILVNLFFCYLILTILGSEIEEVVSRIGYYFFIGIAYMFSILPLYMNGHAKYSVAIVPLLFALLKFSLMMNTPATKITYTPYTNYIFNSTENREKGIFIKKNVVSDYYLDKLDN